MERMEQLGNFHKSLLVACGGTQKQRFAKHMVKESVSIWPFIQIHHPLFFPYFLNTTSNLSGAKDNYPVGD